MHMRFDICLFLQHCIVIVITTPKCRFVIKYKNSLSVIPAKRYAHIFSNMHIFSKKCTYLCKKIYYKLLDNNYLSCKLLYKWGTNRCSLHLNQKRALVNTEKMGGSRDRFPIDKVWDKYARCCKSWATSPRRRSTAEKYVFSLDAQVGELHVGT